MNTHGFELVREESLAEVGGIARLWRHLATGAELLSVCNADENKTFGVSFRTPPKDSTGVAHVLEHSVLCGSDKYPVKEPFVELLKSSLQTFLNALTFPDKTCYPVASCNLRDFYNLVDVYIDAVFHPRIDENVLRQEGWHIEADGTDAPWEYKGVVYNEMKGVYSSPESVLMEECQHAVFPDTLYGLDSGGDPAVIPSLTYEAFRGFHNAYYHPSNARFFFWGDDEEEARLALLEKALAGYGRVEVDSAVALQQRLPEPRRMEVPYAASEGAGAEKAHVAVNWLLCETRETEELFVLDMLEHIISGLPGSPLRKALMDSGLGEDIAGCGLEGELRQAYFSIGLYSVDVENASKVEGLIMDELASLAGQGIPERAVAAALNTLEFMLRENNTGSTPRGLSAMFRSLSEWLYDGDPFSPLAWEKPLASIKARLASGEKVFENAIRRWFLGNTHRVTVVLLPDTALAAARQAEEDARLRAVRDAMTPEQQAEVAAVSEALHEAQRRPDSQEALDTVPSLSREDMPRENMVIPCRVDKESEPVFVVHELDTTGILYACMAFDLSHVPAGLVPLIPLYARALTELGTRRRDYVDLGLEISARTGSLGAGTVLLTRVDDGSPVFKLAVSCKCTADRIDGAVDLLREVLEGPDFGNAARFGQMMTEEKARMEQAAVPSGHSLVAMRLGGRLSCTGRISEAMGGVENMHFVAGKERAFATEGGALMEQLAELHRLVVRRNGLVIDFTGDAGLVAAAKASFASLAKSLPEASFPKAERVFAPLPGAELLSVPSQVNYVGLGFSLKDTGYRYNGSLAVIMRHLRMGYLWDRVRVLGGAYGCFGRFSRSTGAFTFASYRDPNVEKTLDVYRASAGYLADLRLSEADITRAVVGAVGDLDSYMLPGARGAASFARLCAGDTEEDRLRIRGEILATKLSDFHDFAPYLAAGLKHAVPCVLGGADASAMAERNGWTVTRVL